MQLRRTAVHEAGHVVVGYHLGLRCETVALTHDEVEQTGSYGTAVGPHPAYGYHHATSRDRAAAVRDECIVACAGLAAEHVCFGVVLDLANPHARGDFQNIIDLESRGELIIPGKRGGAVGDDTTREYIDKLLRKATRLVKAHRAQIERLADLLCLRSRLSAEEVETFFREDERAQTDSD